MTEQHDEGFELLPPTRRRVSGKLLTSVAAVIVLAGGGAVTYVAFAAGNSGANTPRAAVQKAIGDLEHSDLVGLVDDLAPGERAALAGPVRTDVASLKRLGVLSGAADASAVSGVHFAANNLKYADRTIKINDHVQIVRIVGGSVTVSGDTSQLPLTDQFVKAAKVRPQKSGQTVSIGHPVRIATEKVGDTWYPSIFYTIADEAAGHAVPTSSDAIPATGAGSAEAAVRTLVQRMLGGDYRSALAVLSPDELRVVHDYGGMLLRHAAAPRATQLSIKTLDLTSSPIDNGRRVGLKRIVAQVRGIQVTVARSHGCFRIDAGPLRESVCADNAADVIGSLLGNIRCATSFSFGASSYTPLNGTQPLNRCKGPQFSAAQKHAISDLVTGLTKNTGIDTVQIGGKWFVAPVRTLADGSSAVLAALKGNDLFELATLGS